MRRAPILLSLLPASASFQPLQGQEPVYPTFVAPILEERCVACHGEDRSEAGLRLDSHAAVLKGSDYEAVVSPGDAAGSLLAQALRAPLDDALHMPPEDEAQPSLEEIAVLEWWIAQGAPAEATLAELDTTGVEEALRVVRSGEAGTAPARADATPELDPAAVLDLPTGVEFEAQVLPVLQRSCFPCHGGEDLESDVRLDLLDPDLVAGPDAESWHVVLDMVNGGDMPPRRAEPLALQDRRLLVAWLTESLAEAARARAGDRRVVLRRLNKAQYTNTLQDLLGIGIDFGRVLPDDGKSEMGFTNNGEVLQASALHIDYYQALARQALNEAIATGERPRATRYKITFGTGVGEGEVAGTTGGYQSVPLKTRDFKVEVLDSYGLPEPVDSDEERAVLDAIKQKISVGLRGSSQNRFRVVPEGLILFSALPHKEVAPGSWQGPSPNVKLELQRVFPETGDFVLRVRASRGYVPQDQQELLLALEEPRALHVPGTDREGTHLFRAADAKERENLVERDGFHVPQDVPAPAKARFELNLERGGFFQFDLVHGRAPLEGMPSVRLTLDDRTLDMRFAEAPEAFGVSGDDEQPRVTPIGCAYLRSGTHRLEVGGPFFAGFSHVAVTPLPADHEAVSRLTTDTSPIFIDDRLPALRAFIGTRTDDGMDYKHFDVSREVEEPLGTAGEYVFRGRLENLPIPEPESGDTEILSGILVLGVWNDHLVKRGNQTGPPVLIESLEFEAPYHTEWPPSSHRRIFFESELAHDEPAYAREILRRFMRRAFRRSLLDGEEDRYFAFWEATREDHRSFEESIREALVAVLCSPRFLYIAEPAPQDDGEAVVTQEMLASRLSYFLWNSPPDEGLLELAADGLLRDRLRETVDAMVEDERVWRFVRAFAYEWLRLDRHQLMSINANRYPDYTRFVKHDMAQETYHFVHEVLARDASVFTLIESDFAMLNQNLAEFYRIDGVHGTALRPVAIRPEERRGGLLSQGAFLAGHSDGTEPHPIKRAVWLKEKILGEVPPPPPPNVPDLDPDAPGFEDLTLKEQLEKHRDNPSCFDCHRSIDPYGVVFENYDAVGRFQEVRKDRPIDASSVLPDGTRVDGVDGLKRHILEDVPEKFVRALAEHLFAYALGRDVHFADEEELEQIVERVRSEGYRFRSLITAVVESPSFAGGER